MKTPNHRLTWLISLARRAPPPPIKPATPEDVRFFAQRTVSASKRRRATGAPPDPLRLWERAGNWSLATAALVLIVVLQPGPAPANPFDVFGPVGAEEINLF